MPKQTLSSREALEIIIKRSNQPMSARQLRHEMQTGKLKATKKANRWEIEPEDLDKYERRLPGRKPKDNQKIP